jgi:AcrR family transcriptional regulator
VARGRPRRGSDDVPQPDVKSSRIGRPPVSESIQTRQRILDSARVCFVRLGFDQTTVKDIASEAGITAGALYYHFDSKQDIFVSVYRWIQQLVFSEFDQVLGETEGTVLARLGAVLEKAAEMHARDRQLAAFTAISPIEIQRHEDLRRLVGDDARTVYRFCQRMVEEADDRVDGEDKTAVVNMLVAIMNGFSMLGATVHSTGAHRDAIDVFTRLLTEPKSGLSSRIALPGA